jgi:hypothetical protein
MIALLDPSVAERLARICGMFGSHHDGERAAAAAKADQLVRGLGLTWVQIIALPGAAARDPETVPEKLAFALANIVALSMWECSFVYGINGKLDISPKQVVILDQIVAKARTYADARSWWAGGANA